MLLETYRLHRLGRQSPDGRNAMAQRNLNRHLMAVREAPIWVVAVWAAAMSSLLNLSHLSNPLKQSQLFAELLNGFPQTR